MESSEEKYLRSQIDDTYRRNNAPNSYKNRQFNGYRVATDQYTGKKVYYSWKGANSAKGAPRHFTTQTTSNVDHIQPIDVVNKHYASRMSAEDMKRIANSDYNLALTNEALNKAKSGSTNFQYLQEQFKKGTPEDITTTVNMLSLQVNADVHIKIEAESTIARRSIESKLQSQQIKEAVETAGTKATDSIHVGASAAMVSLTVSSLNNICYVASGKKDLESALRDVGSDTANSAVSAMGLDATQKIISRIAEKTDAKQLAAITKQQLPVAEIALATMVAGSVSRYLDGEISGEDCVIEILLNGAGTYAYQLGALVGGPVGAVVASVIVTQIANTIVEYRQIKKIAAAKDAEVNTILRDAMAEIVNQRNEIKEYFDKEGKRWDDTIDNGFALILSSALEQNSTGITSGLNMILSLFNTHAYYQNLEEFDEDFFNPESTVIL